MERLVRILATTAAYFASLVAIAVTTFFVVIFLAGLTPAFCHHGLRQQS